MSRRPSLGAIFLTVFIDLLGFGLVIPFLSTNARDDFHTTAFMGTLIGSVYSLMQFLFVPVWGALSDRIGRRPIMIWSVAASSLSMLGLGLALAYGNSIGWLFLARGISGIATANLGTASAYIADITAPKDRARGMGMIGMAFGLGFIFGPVVGGFLADIQVNHRSGPIACYLAAALSVINFIWVVLGLPESLPAKQPGAVIVPNTHRRSLMPMNPTSLKRAFSHAGVTRAILVNFIIIVSFVNIEQIFPLFNLDEFSIARKGTGLFLLLVGVVAAGVQGGLMRPLTKRFPEPPIIRAGVFLQMLAFVALALSPNIGAWFIYVGCILLALGNGLTQPTVSAQISKSAPPAEQGSVLGTSQGFASLARVIGPMIAGATYTAIGHRAPYLAAAGGMIVALILAFELRPIVMHDAPALEPAGDESTAITD